MYKAIEISPTDDAQVQYKRFYLSLICEDNGRIIVTSHDSYKGASLKRKFLIEDSGNDEQMRHYKYLVSAEVQIGNNKPVIVGYDTNANPFKLRYQQLKDAVRFFIISQEQPYNYKGVAFECGLTSTAKAILYRDLSLVLPFVPISQPSFSGEPYRESMSLLDVKNSLEGALSHSHVCLRTSKENEVVSFLNNFVSSWGMDDIDALGIIANNISLYR